MITKNKFNAYLTVQRSGSTNMFNILTVIRYAKTMTGIKLTKEEITDIFKHYDNYKKKYEKS